MKSMGEHRDPSRITTATEQASLIARPAQVARRMSTVFSFTVSTRTDQDQRHEKKTFVFFVISCLRGCI
jgi:hypothetical protein